MKDLTVRQKAVLGFIRKCYEEDNRGPTIREVAMFVSGSKNSGAAACHLTALEKKGYITRARDNLSRGIMLTHPPLSNREKVLVAAARALLMEWDDELGEIETDELRNALATYEGFQACVTA